MNTAQAPQPSPKETKFHEAECELKLALADIRNEFKFLADELSPILTPLPPPNPSPAVPEAVKPEPVTSEVVATIKTAARVAFDISRDLRALRTRVEV